MAALTSIICADTPVWLRILGFIALLELLIGLNVFMLVVLGALLIDIYEGMLMERGNIHRLTRFFKLAIHFLYLYTFNDVVTLHLNIMLSTMHGALYQQCLNTYGTTLRSTWWNLDMEYPCS